ATLLRGLGPADGRGAEVAHWLALLADEAGVADRELVEASLRRGEPIEAEAASALVSRLGASPPGHWRRRSVGEPPPAEALQTARVPEPGDLANRLKAIVRGSREGAKSICDLLEGLACYPDYLREVMNSIATEAGDPRIVASLRFQLGDAFLPRLLPTLLA